MTNTTSNASLGGLTTPTSPRPCATDMSGLPGTAGAIVVGYRGTFAFGRDGMADVCFRKLTRILVHGKVISYRMKGVELIVEYTFHITITDINHLILMMNQFPTNNLSI